MSNQLSSFTTNNSVCSSLLFISNSTKVFLLFLGLFILLQLKLYGQTNNYFGNSGALSAAVWSANSSGPFTSLLNSTGGAILNFDNPATINGATMDLRGINVSANLKWINNGTMGTNGLVLPINVLSGVTLNMSQTTSVAVGTGFNKLGSGVLSMSGGSNYQGGFSLNEGTILIEGVNALGGNRLSLNAGIIASSANIILSNKYKGGIYIGGNTQWGDVIGLANANASLNFNDSIYLGNLNRTLSIGNAGTMVLSGPISNVGSAGISFTANNNGTGIFDIANNNNTFTGPISIIGGKVRFASNGSFGNTANPIILDGGKLLSQSTYSIFHPIQLGESFGTGIDVAPTDTLTIEGVISDKTVLGTFNKSGAGLLSLTNSNTYTGPTFIDVAGGILQLNHLAGNTLPISNDLAVYGGMLMISSNQSLNNLSMVSGNLHIDNGVTLTINGTFDYFQSASITLIGSGKINYGPLGALKYSGNILKIISPVEFPNLNGPYSVICNNNVGITLPFDRTITGKLILTFGKFTIGGGALLELDGASLESSGGYISGNAINGSNSNLTVKGSTGGLVTIPTNNLNIGLKNILVGGSRTLSMNGINNLVLSGNLLIEKDAAFDNGGESQITSATGLSAITIDGKFINRDKDNFTGIGGAIPGIIPLLNAGCTIDYALSNGNQQVVTSRNDYRNISFSGSGIKTLASGFNPAGIVNITNNAIVDALNFSFGDAGSRLTMDGGRLRLHGTNNPQPHMSSDYQLTGGVIEFACNNVSGQTIRSKVYQNIEVSGLYVGNSSGNISLNNNGTFKIVSGGVFSINDNSIKAADNTNGQIVTVENNGTFLSGNSKGFNGFVSSLMDNSSIHSNITSIGLAPGIPGSNVHYTKLGDQPITNANGLVYCNLLLSGSGNKIAPGGLLTVTGNFSKNSASIFQHNNSSVIFSNDSIEQHIGPTVEPSLIFHDLTINNKSELGLQLKTTISIGHELLLLSNSKLNLADADIRLLSSASNTSRVGVIPSSASIIYTGTGRFIVERYFPNANPITKRAWRMVTAPVKQTGSIFENWQLSGAAYDPSIVSGNIGRGTLITGPVTSINGMDFTPTNNYSLKRFVNQAYINITNTQSKLSIPIGSLEDEWADNTSYFLFVRGDRNPILTNTANSNSTTLISRGRLQTGTLNIPINNNIELVGNPYASSIDFNLINKSNNVYARRFYVWDPNLNRVGGFVVMDDFSSPGNFIPKAPYGSSSQRNHIQSGQAFMVERVSNSTSILKFEEQSKSSLNNTIIFKPFGNIRKESTLSIQLQMMMEDYSLRLADGVLLEFNNQYSDKVDKEDAIKLVNINESFNLVRDGIKLAVERRTFIKRNDTLFFQVSRTSSKKYQLIFSPKNLDSAVEAILEDAYLVKRNSFSLNSFYTYAFTINKDSLSYALDRFRLVFRKNISLNKNLSDTVFKVYRKNNKILVEWLVGNEVGFSKYDVEKSVDGIHFKKVHTFLHSDFNKLTNLYSWTDGNPMGGDHFYRIRSESDKVTFSYSNPIKVKEDESTTGVILLSNPTRVGEISLFFKNLPAGAYKIRLINSIGQTIFTQIILHTIGSSSEKIYSGIKLPPGIYQLEIVYPNNECKVLKMMVS